MMNLSLESFFVSGFSKLSLKAPITTAADDSLKYFFFDFLEKLRLDISCESFARQKRFT